MCFHVTTDVSPSTVIGLIIIVCDSVVSIETRSAAGQSGVPITAKKNSLFTKTPTQSQIELTARFFRADRAVGARS